MGADQFILPHLGARARMLLDRIVASGADGVDRRDADDWALSRLIDLRYVEESPLDDLVFVCTEAGRRRWQIEILADEQRDASALRRRLIRNRLDERFSRLGLGTSTALTTVNSPAEPRLYRGVSTLPGPPPKAGTRLTSALAALFAVGAAALVVISASTEPQDVQEWLSRPMPHAATVPWEPPPKANAQQAALVSAPVPAIVTAPVAPAQAVASADAAPLPTQRPAVASMDTIAEGYGGITFQPEQYVWVPDAMLATTEGAGRKRSPVSDAGSPDDGVLLNAAAAAADLIGSAVRQSSHIAADLTTGVERGVKSIATGMIDSALSESARMATELATGVERGVSSMTASLLHAIVEIVEMDRAVAAPDGAIQQVRDEGPAPPAPGAESPPERGRQATLWPVSGLGTEPVRAVVAHARSDERATAKTPAVRTDDTNVDPQHALVERLNLLSLAAARHGQTWRPNSPRDVAETSGLP